MGQQTPRLISSGPPTLVSSGPPTLVSSKPSPTGSIFEQVIKGLLSPVPAIHDFGGEMANAIEGVDRPQEPAQQAEIPGAMDIVNMLVDMVAPVRPVYEAGKSALDYAMNGPEAPAFNPNRESGPSFEAAQDVRTAGARGFYGGAAQWLGDRSPLELAMAARGLKEYAHTSAAAKPVVTGEPPPPPPPKLVPKAQVPPTPPIEQVIGDILEEIRNEGKQTVKQLPPDIDPPMPETRSRQTGTGPVIPEPGGNLNQAVESGQGGGRAQSKSNQIRQQREQAIETEHQRIIRAQTKHRAPVAKTEDIGATPVAQTASPSMVEKFAAKDATGAPVVPFTHDAIQSLAEGRVPQAEAPARVSHASADTEMAAATTDELVKLVDSKDPATAARADAEVYRRYSDLTGGSDEPKVEPIIPRAEKLAENLKPETPVPPAPIPKEASVAAQNEITRQIARTQKVIRSEVKLDGDRTVTIKEKKMKKVVDPTAVATATPRLSPSQVSATPVPPKTRYPATAEVKKIVAEVEKARVDARIPTIKGEKIADTVKRIQAARDEAEARLAGRNPFAVPPKDPLAKPYTSPPIDDPNVQLNPNSRIKTTAQLKKMTVPERNEYWAQFETLKTEPPPSTKPPATQLGKYTSPDLEGPTGATEYDLRTEAEGLRKAAADTGDSVPPTGVDADLHARMVAVEYEAKALIHERGIYDPRLINELRQYHGATKTAQRLGISKAKVEELGDVAGNPGRRRPITTVLSEMDARFKFMMDDPRGFLRAEAMIAAGGAAAGGAVGAVLGGEDAKDVWAGALSGAIIGGFAGFAGARNIPKMKGRFTKAKALAQWEATDSANLLAGPAVLKSTIGSFQGVSAGWYQRLREGKFADARRGMHYVFKESHKDFWNIMTGPEKNLTRIGAYTNDVAAKLGQRAPATNRFTRFVLRPFIAGDRVGTIALKRMGFSEAEAQRLMLVGEPTTWQGQAAMGVINSHFVFRMLAKFPRVRIGGLERGVEFTPGLHKLVDVRHTKASMSKSTVGRKFSGMFDEQEGLSAKARQARAEFGGMMIAGGFAYGYLADPDLMKMGIAASVAGPANLPALAAMNLGKALRHTDIPGALSAAALSVAGTVPQISEADVRPGRITRRFVPPAWVRDLVKNE